MLCESHEFSWQSVSIIPVVNKDVLRCVDKHLPPTASIGRSTLDRLHSLEKTGYSAHFLLRGNGRPSFLDRARIEILDRCARRNIVQIVVCPSQRKLDFAEFAGQHDPFNLRRFHEQRYGLRTDGGTSVVNLALSHGINSEDSGRSS